MYKFLEKKIFEINQYSTIRVHKIYVYYFNEILSIILINTILGTKLNFHFALSRYTNVITHFSVLYNLVFSAF